jgi:hypothetical protein
MKLGDAVSAILLGIVVGLLLVCGWAYCLNNVIKAILGG